MNPGLGPYFVPLRKTLVPLAIKENNQVLLLVGPLNECWLGVKLLSLYFTGTGVSSSGVKHLCLSMDLFPDLARNHAIELVSVISCNASMC